MADIKRHGHRSPSQFTRDEMDEIPIAAQALRSVPKTLVRYRREIGWKIGQDIRCFYRLKTGEFGAYRLAFFKG